MKKFQIKHYQLHLNKEDFPQRQVRLAFLTDLHNVCFGTEHEILIRKLEELQPDAVLVGGDILIAKPGQPLTQAVSLLHQLAGRFRVYYALGNHEYRLKIYPCAYGDMYERYRAALASCPIHWLENESEILDLDGLRLQIFGLEMDRKYYQRFSHPELSVSELKELLGRPDPKLYSVLLAHHPGYGKTYLEWGADLTLCGHFHGGIMRLGRQGVISPDVRFFPSFSYGLYKRENSRMIVSGGLGEHTIPLRIFNPRELVVIDLDFRKGTP